jgi:hypothetical protein
MAKENPNGNGDLIPEGKRIYAGVLCASVGGAFLLLLQWVFSREIARVGVSHFASNPEAIVILKLSWISGLSWFFMRCAWIFLTNRREQAIFNIPALVLWVSIISAIGIVSANESGNFLFALASAIVIAVFLKMIFEDPDRRT